MKKLITILSCAVLMIFISSCGGAGGDVAIGADEAAAQLMENITFRDELVKVQGDVAGSYYKFDDTVTEYCIYLSGSGATAEEIAVLKVQEGTDAAGAKPILEKRVESQKIKYTDYVPGEMVKIESPVIKSKGNMIVMVLADDQSQAEKAIDEIFK